MGSPDIKLIPTDFDVDMDATVGTVSSVTATTTAAITGRKDAPVSLSVDPLAVQTTIRGDPAAPLETRAGVELDLRNLPHLTFEQISALVDRVTLAKSRIRFPVKMSFGFSVFPLTLFGVDAVRFSVRGESTIVRDDCVPDCDEPADAPKGA